MRRCECGANPKTRAAFAHSEGSPRRPDYMPVVVVAVVVSIVVESIVIESAGIGAGVVGAGAGIVVLSIVVSAVSPSSAEQAPSTSSDDAARTVKNERFMSTSDKVPK